MSLAKCVELRFDRRGAGRIHFRKSIDSADEFGHGRLDPLDRLDDALVLLRQRPVPDRLMMEDAVAELAHLVESLDQVDACAVPAWHVREGLLDEHWPEHLLVAPIQEAGPESEVELGDDATDIGLLALAS